MQYLSSLNFYTIWEWIEHLYRDYGDRMVMLIVCSLGLLGIAKLLFDLVKAIAHRHQPAIFPSDCINSCYVDMSAGGMDSSYKIESIEPSSIDCCGGDAGGGE